GDCGLIVQDSPRGLGPQCFPPRAGYVPAPPVGPCEGRAPGWPQIQPQRLFALFASSLFYSSITDRMESRRCRKTANNAGSVGEYAVLDTERAAASQSSCHQGEPRFRKAAGGPVARQSSLAGSGVKFAIIPGFFVAVTPDGAPLCRFDDPPGGGGRGQY